mgnify:CR=1 FL=1
MNVWIAVMLGGAVGSAGRYGVGLLLRNIYPSFPIATLTVNAVGGLLVGLLASYSMGRTDISDVLRFGLITGVLGGFTTFSSFSMETLQLWRDGTPVAALLNIGLNLFLSLGGCMAGLWLARASTA